MERAGGVVPIESLLAHRDWVRRLARALARDESGADDLEQEAWLRAMRRPPSHAASLRGWLGTVLRRLAVDRGRSERSLARREESASRGEATVPSPADLVAEAEAHRRVVEAVLSLEEPYRTTVLLRWFEDLPPTELARRLGVPVETVRSRLRRAGERLRERLGGDRDGGSAWKAALLPLVARGQPDPVAPWTGVPWKGVAIMGAKSTKAAVAAGAVLAFGLGWWLLSSPGGLLGQGGGDPAAATLASARPVRGRGGSAAPGSEVATEPGAARPAADPGSAGGAPAAPADPPPPTRFEKGQDRISGRVVDPAGGAATGVRVRLLSMEKMLGPGESLPAPTREAETDEHGRFGFDGFGAADVYLCVRLDAPGYLKRETWVGPGTHRIEFVLVTARPLGGVVVDRDTGAGIEGMLILVRPADAGPLGPVFPARTGADGAFALADLAEGRYTVEAGEPAGNPAGPASAYVPAKVEGVAAGTTDLRVVLSKGLSISGTILDASGRPVTSPVTVTVLGKTGKGGPDYSRYRYQVVGRPDVAGALTGRRKDFDGTFTVPGLPPGNYDLTFTPEAAKDADPSLPVPVTATTVADVPAGTDGLRVTMRSGKPLTGFLVDDAGEPVKTVAYLYVYLPGGPPGGTPLLTAMSKEDGTFATPPLDEGCPYDVLVVMNEGYMQARVNGLFAGDPPAKVVLTRAAAISGLVQDEDGRPVGAGIPVSARGENVDQMKPGSGMVAYTQPDGAFRIDGLGTALFTLVAGGGETAFAPGPPTRGVKAGSKDLILKVRKGVVLSGVLQDGDGRPFKTHYLGGSGIDHVGGVTSWTRVENEEGRFTLRGLPAGKVRLACYAGETFVPLGDFTAPAEDVVVKVP